MIDTADVAQRTPGAAQGLALSIPVCLAVMGSVLLAPVLPQMRAQFADVPNANLLVPLTLTIPAACLALLSPLAGWLMDRFGRRSLVMGAMLVYAIVGVAPFWLSSLSAIFLSRIGVGACEAVILTGTTTLLGDYFKDSARDRWIANQTAIASLSSLAFFAIGGELGVHSWRLPFLMYASSLPMLAMIWRQTWEPSDSARILRRSGSSATPLPWLRLLGICSITVLSSIFFYTLAIHLSVALVEHGTHSPRAIGWICALVVLGVPLGTLGFRAAARRLPTERLLALEFFIIGIGFVGMARTQHFPLFVALGALNQFGCGMILPTLVMWAIRGLHFDNRGRGIGIWQASFTIGQPLGAIITPALVAMRGGSTSSALQLLGFVALAAFGVAAVVAFLAPYSSLAHPEPATRASLVNYPKDSTIKTSRSLD